MLHIIIIMIQIPFLNIMYLNASIFTSVDLQHLLELLLNILLYEQMTVYPFSGSCLYICGI